MTESEARQIFLDALAALGPRRRVLVIPPDITRMHSRAGFLCRWAYEYYGDALKAVLPALGTHRAMTRGEWDRMYEGVPFDLMHVHRWREDLVSLGTVPGAFVDEISEGRVAYDWPAQVNALLLDGDFDLILSLGQVVPHEVVGMANHAKNLFVGTGGSEGIHKSHYLGAVYGMERVMGRTDSPVRAVLDYAAEHFLKDLPVVYAQTVVSGGRQPALEGLFVGEGREPFERAAELSRQVNLTLLDRAPKKVVAYLDPDEFKSTWLGNKAVYRSRMAIADGGELIVLAPGVEEFGEDPGIDALIRRYGYRSSAEIIDLVGKNDDLAGSLSAAAHLIHGSPEDRFSVTYAPGNLTREEMEGVGYSYGNLDDLSRRYDPSTLSDGWNVVDNEEIYYLSNPALGLWAEERRFT